MESFEDNYYRKYKTNDHKNAYYGHGQHISPSYHNTARNKHMFEHTRYKDRFNYLVHPHYYHPHYHPSVSATYYEYQDPAELSNDSLT
jgi:hypothetical protein